MNDLKKKVEAVLFSAGKAVQLDFLVKSCRADKPDILEALRELKEDAVKSESPYIFVQEGESWKMTIREKYLPLVHKLMPDTELPKSILETLAVIAWKHPIKQSEIIKMRSNKAYEHLKILEDTGFILKERFGRTYLIKGTTKLHEYFDVSGHEELKKQLEELSNMGETKEHVGKLEVYDEPEEKQETLGKLDIFEEPVVEEPVVKDSDVNEPDIEESTEPEQPSEPEEKSVEESSVEESNNPDDETKTQDNSKQEDSDISIVEPENLEKEKEKNDEQRELEPELEHMIEEKKPDKKKEDENEDEPIKLDRM